MENIIEVRSLTKRYGEFTAVDNIEFSVKKGIIFGFLGPNGAGKTTTIRTLTGRLKSTSGDAFVLGKNIQSDMDDIYNEIGVVSESQNLYERLTVLENIEFFRQLYKASKQNLEEVLEVLDLNHKRNAPVSSLSKGLKQRVLLSRSILHQPKLIFLDEPTSGLDPQSANAVQAFIKTMNEKGTSIFLTTHDMDEADRLCHDIAFINQGKIVAQGSPEDLKKPFRKNIVDVFFEGDSECRNYDLNKDGLSELARDAESKNVLKMNSREVTLREVFLELADKG